ncbi:serine/threonine-protein kinase [Streptacidiphilus anmyonensis]|uniref:serine/threonine-protein kinase n=1 Tax=Streptacidiphilus anmyonensis TaxID=405782 RepID=UPI0005AB7273|nr:serine/threonine-protein kinase [Streptacidiphilus anmyonensis]
MIDSTIAEPLGPDDPQEIGSFTVIGLLGTGGMGEVYLGASDKGYAAVKRVRPRLVSSERFEREVGILYRVPVGVAPRVLASDSTTERPWFAAEYVPGLTVDEAIRLRGPLPAEALWLLLAETAGQLRAVHASGIVHRDIKPGNVMLVRDGVKLIDFGIARAADQARLTRSGGSYGTQGFSAPEQQAGADDVAAPADVYALGALLLYAASGRTPGVVPDVEPLRAVDADLATVVASCLATGPRSRPDVGAVEETARAHLPVPSPSDPPRPSGPPRPVDLSWPPEVMSRITSRRAFAATPVGKLETVPPPSLDADPKPAAASTPASPASPPSPASPHRPRRRTLLLVLPTATVIALGAVAAFTLIPPASPQHGTGQSSGTASVTVAPVAGTTPTSSTRPSSSASSSAKSPTATSVPGQGLPAGTPPPGASRTSPAASTTATTPSAPAPSVTASSIGGISGNNDSTQVKGSEADTSWLGNDAACSAWLDDNGSGRLAGVLNTSLNQVCDAELYRSDGIAFTFQASWGAAKTNFIPVAGDTMWICVWNTSNRSGEQCSARFTMNGTTPVER